MINMKWMLVYECTYLVWQNQLGNWQLHCSMMHVQLLLKNPLVLKSRLIEICHKFCKCLSGSVVVLRCSGASAKICFSLCICVISFKSCMHYEDLVSSKLNTLALLGSLCAWKIHCNTWMVLAATWYYIWSLDMPALDLSPLVASRTDPGTPVLTRWVAIAVFCTVL